MSEQDEKPRPKFTVYGYDDWSRRLFKSEKTGRIYVQVDGALYTRTDWDEPDSPLCSLDAIDFDRSVPNQGVK